MWKTTPKFLLIVFASAILAVLIMSVIGRSVFAQHAPGTFVDNPNSYSSLACREYLSGKSEESLALYQKAIDKAATDYGTNSSLVGALSYEMAMRAYDMGKFDLAERSLKKAVAVNPNCLPAQLMLGKLLQFRDKNSEAYAAIEQAVSKHWDSTEARREMMLCMQGTDPASAAQQAFIINCLQNGSLSKIPAEQRPKKPPANISLTKDTQKIAPNMPKNKSPIPLNTLTTPAIKMVTTQGKLDKDQINNIQLKIMQLEKVLQGVTKTSGKEIHKAGVKHASQAKNKSKRSGHKAEHISPFLVPPPPLPSWFGIPDGNQKAAGPPSKHTGLKAKAGSIRSDTANAKSDAGNVGVDANRPVSVKKSHTGTESDSDFLLDWGGIKKKK